MVFLKEDDSLDIERINKLSQEEYMNMMGKLTQVQIQEYLSKLPINESNEPMKVTTVNYSMEEDGVDAKELINNLRKKLMKKHKNIGNNIIIDPN
jgi:hypothetical protein